MGPAVDWVTDLCAPRRDRCGFAGYATRSEGISGRMIAGSPEYIHREVGGGVTAVCLKKSEEKPGKTEEIVTELNVPCSQAFASVQYNAF